MIRRATGFLLALTLFLSIQPGAFGGGVATVHLDAVPDGVTAGVPIRIGFMVMQHDVTPVNVDSAVLEATHRETGEQLGAVATQKGATGHYVVEVTFPTAGSWKWSIIPAPFAGTSFETIEVGEAGAGSEPDTWTAQVREGTCANLRDPIVEIPHIIALSAPDEGMGSPVGVITAHLELAPDAIMATQHALLIVAQTEPSIAPVACADLEGTIYEGELIVGIHEIANSGTIGIATIAKAGTGSNLVLYLSTAQPERVAESMTIEIIGSQGSWSYDPATLDISVGTTVTWVNRTDTSHTVTGTDLTYEDSGPIPPGGEWSQTFAVPGTFSYFCAPHPLMTAEITIA